jgi:hypothetical protein
MLWAFVTGSSNTSRAISFNYTNIFIVYCLNKGVDFPNLWVNFSFVFKIKYVSILPKKYALIVHRWTILSRAKVDNIVCNSWTILSKIR